jgi:GTP-binding protein EngB required for normal cell division
VRPVCLWNFDSDLKNVVDKLGSGELINLFKLINYFIMVIAVPGWGYNENGLVSEDLSYVQMPVINNYFYTFFI